MIQSTPRSNASLAIHVVRPHKGALGSLRILAGVEQTLGLYFAFESETGPAPSGAALDVHAHAAYEESEYVLSGARRARRIGASGWIGPSSTRIAYLRSYPVTATRSGWSR